VGGGHYDNLRLKTFVGHASSPGAQRTEMITCVMTPPTSIRLCNRFVAA
jgi:hypothetical protein